MKKLIKLIKEYDSVKGTPISPKVDEFVNKVNDDHKPSIRDCFRYSNYTDIGKKIINTMIEIEVEIAEMLLAKEIEKKKLIENLKNKIQLQLDKLKGNYKNICKDISRIDGLKESLNKLLENLNDLERKIENQNTEKYDYLIIDEKLINPKFEKSELYNDELMMENTKKLETNK